MKLIKLSQNGVEVSETAEKFWIKFGIGGPCKNLFGKFHFDPYEPSVGPCYTKLISRIALRPFR
jgi:hypothetical protein